MVNPSGKRGITFDVSTGFVDMPIELPCGRCIGCRLEYSRQWAIRCTHEAALWERNCFVTLTYEDSQLPKSWNGLPTLRPVDYVLFMKRLRKQFGPGIRFFHCGEYGENFGRPHHHALLFNWKPPDLKALRFVDSVRDVATSATLEKLWGHGYVAIGECTFESAAYVARYCLKKHYGKGSDDHYLGRTPEYLTMSRRPGIGAAWLEKFKGDVYPSDEVVIRGGIKCRPPKFYDGKIDETLLAKLKRKRVLAMKDDPDSTVSRLIVREELKQRTVRAQLERKYESGVTPPLNPLPREGTD